MKSYANRVVHILALGVMALGAVVSSTAWAAIAKELKASPQTTCEDYGCSEPGGCPHGCACGPGGGYCGAVAAPIK
jgi:hypothetical protein